MDWDLNIGRQALNQIATATHNIYDPDKYIWLMLALCWASVADGGPTLNQQ